MKLLTFIIVTHNSAKIIRKSLSRINLEKYEVIIVDNASQDDVVAIVKKDFPQVKVIENEKNIGFGRANNIGFSRVKTEFSCILNPDCFIDEKSISQILDVMGNNSQIALASGVMHSGSISKNGKIIPQENPLKIAQKNYLTELTDFYETKFLSGCCLFVRKNIFQEIGLFDEKFFLYCEDNELCKRVLRSGYKIATVKNSKIIHLSGKSSTPLNSNIEFAISWHRFGWSKCYYAEAVHNKFVGKVKALKNILRIIGVIFYRKIIGAEITIKNKAALLGCFEYLIGKGAFREDGSPQKF